MTERYLADDMLIQRAQGGDRGALDMLVEKHETRAYQYAFRLTRNPDEAADIVADAFVRVVNALPNFKGQSAFSTWLYRILTNCFLDQRKKDRTRGVVSLESVMQTDEGELERQVEDPAGDVFEQTARLERGRLVEIAVSRLPEYQRAMIVMYHADRLAYDEIAAALDLPIGTVKSRLNRARLSLRELLARDEELFKMG
ncbi:MAG: sigma-70 family RNA polymerase sigma factor [Fimbriimonas ginsengisoli]|uniref:Sigma-70 family RNA polymerase sigma factor n=1 Tax=Fimbriimonas ginsengisoli TaxID=1005039 RepID=A0A931LR60_FIMGI|nr:sigma-70 family RNA polymerase sigma factor [Fimbriimonas ginsengisoli]MBI3722086.1 sigma-70 family RNA polymerase sigma factor [Fimbriimonas ginsengisoli]